MECGERGRSSLRQAWTPAVSSAARRPTSDARATRPRRGVRRSHRALCQRRGRLSLTVRFHGGNRHLPLVKLRRVA